MWQINLEKKKKKIETNLPGSNDLHSVRWNGSLSGVLVLDGFVGKKRGHDGCDRQGGRQTERETGTSMQTNSGQKKCRKNDGRRSPHIRSFSLSLKQL